MKTRTLLVTLLATLSTCSLIAQTKIEYPHCNCSEVINKQTGDTSKPDGNYQLICDNKPIITGQYRNGLKSGKWTTQTAKGTIIKNAEYLDGKLNGKYELFHHNGKPKLVAGFVNGQQDGLWEFYNEFGKVVKTGTYESGRPVGIWTINHKIGPKRTTTYDFSDPDAENTDLPPYFLPGATKTNRDDQSGEWYVVYQVNAHCQPKIEPFGGYYLVDDFFKEYLTIPTIMMNTYTNFDFSVTLQVENNVLKAIRSSYSETPIYSPQIPSLSFIVSTNPSRKLKKVTHDSHSINLLNEHIEETVSLLGPWIGTSNQKLYVPFVLNDVWPAK